MNDLVQGAPFGILRGASGHGAGMDVVAPYLDDPPAKGDFALVPGGDGALILRIASAYPTGSFAEASDRGADYLAQLARQPSHVPERVRELLLRFRVEVAPLGFLRTSPRWRFESGVRAIQMFGNPVFRPSRQLLEFLVNVGLQDEDEQQIVPMGRLARGHEATEIPVRFSIRRLKGRRTFIFARAGYGKSNLTKLLLSRLYKAPPDVGLLIVDPEGEYAFSQRSEAGQLIPGLVDHPDLRERVRIFTDRTPPPGAGGDDFVCGAVRVDVARLSPGEFITAFVPPEKSGQVWTNFLRSCARDDWAKLINSLRTRRYQVSDDELAEVLRIRRPSAKDKSEGNSSLNAIRNNVIPALDRLDSAESKLIDLCQKHLFGLGDTPPGVVVLDVSTLAGADADAIVRLVLHSLFRRSVHDFTHRTQRTRGVLFAMEEAQSVFGGRQLDDQDIYVRWVKEGRKYGLGTILITQQPGAIAHELLSQADNFFVMHLLAQRDLDVLGAANAHFTREVLDFIRTEPVKGNCYFWSAPDQPYVVGMRVDDYEKQALAPAPAQGTATPVAPRVSYEDRLARALVSAVCAEARVFLYRVAKLNDQSVRGLVAVAPGYLASSIQEAPELQALRPDDWEQRWERIALRAEALDGALECVRLGGAPLRAAGVVERRDGREMVVIDEKRLTVEARKLGLVVKPTREGAIELHSLP